MYVRAFTINRMTDHLHPGFALALFLEAYGLIWLWRRWCPVNLSVGHSPTIDGLRGFLAFGVFVYHASIWYSFVKTGVWTVPESRFFTHLGQSTVSLFFMITGFLFYGKLLNDRTRPVDWLKLYVSRCLRILPLYMIVMMLTAILIALIRYSGWLEPMQSPWHEKSLTGLITAGVTWTLGYEWKFYFFLPILALTLGQVSGRWLLFSLLMLLLLGAWKAFDIHAAAFAGGIVAALLNRWPRWCVFASSFWSDFLALAILAGVVVFLDTAYALKSVCLLSFSFALIANGATLWGLLSKNISRIFGEMTYSIYLLHGPVLFLAFRFLWGFDRLETLSPVSYWAAVSVLTPVLLGLSTLAYQKIERPFMDKTASLTGLIRKLANTDHQR